MRALLRSVELGDTHQLGIRLYGMVSIFYMSYIHWLQRPKKDPLSRKRAYHTAW